MSVSGTLQTHILVIQCFTDVEHAGGSSGAQVHSPVTPLPQIQFEGFEPSPYEKNDTRAVDLEEAQV